MTKKAGNFDVEAKKPQGYYDNPRVEMLDYIPENCTKSVEFGCGAGDFSSLLKNERKMETWAVEIHKESAQKAALKLDHVINKDAMEAIQDLPDNYFDCAIFFDVLEHLVDPYQLLRDIKLKLKPEGVVICSIPNIRYYRAFKKYVLKGDWEYGDHGIMDKTHLRFFTHKSILKTFDELDYNVVRCDGLHPTSSKTWVLLNILLLNCLWDVRYKHFVVIADKQSKG